MDRDLRRYLLKPLTRRRQGAADQRALAAALDRLDERALGEDLLASLRDVVSAARSDRHLESWKDPDTARKWVALACALYASRRISREEYVHLAASRVEMVHEGRWLDDGYDHDLGPIRRAMDAIQEAHGLRPDEYWAIGEGPEEYSRLNDEYGAVLDRHLVRALREFGLDDLANLQEQNPKEFDRLRERGRRSAFHRDELRYAIRDIVVRCEEDARRAASAGAFFAAVTSLGAGVEGLLVLRCLRSKRKTYSVAKELPRRIRPRSPEDPTTWTFETLIEVCLRAGWLPPVSTSVAQYNAAGLAHLLRLMRNHVHPGRHAREWPWLETDERDYRDAEAIYIVLLSALGGMRPRVRENSA